MHLMSKTQLCIYWHAHARNAKRPNVIIDRGPNNIAQFVHTQGGDEYEEVSSYSIGRRNIGYRRMG